MDCERQDIELNQQTLILIKPDGVRRGLIGEIISRFEKRQLSIIDVMMIKLTRETATSFYSPHKEKPFFNELLEYMTSGSVIKLIIEGESAIEVVRSMIGSTNSLQALSGTIRGDFGLSLTENVIHASDSPSSFDREKQILDSI
jgi:nucleoside-diphosphate kinase|tara:strand:- start:71 stop:502 length:432 start_codon:yes stop_codon:yes gene_type:complete